MVRGLAGPYYWTAALKGKSSVLIEQGPCRCQPIAEEGLENLRGRELKQRLEQAKKEQRVQ